MTPESPSHPAFPDAPAGPANGPASDAAPAFPFPPTEARIPAPAFQSPWPEPPRPTQQTPLLDTVRAARKEAAVAAPGCVELGGRTFVLAPASVEEAQAWYTWGRRAVQADMGDPLAVLNRKLNALQAHAMIPGGEPVNPLLLKALSGEVLSAATADGGAGKADPTADQVANKCLSLDGFRWYTHLRLNRVSPDVTPPWVALHVTADNWGAVSRQFAAIDRLDGLLPNGPPATG